jgi:hypothetical protein
MEYQKPQIENSINNSIKNVMCDSLGHQVNIISLKGNGDDFNKSLDDFNKSLDDFNKSLGNLDTVNTHCIEYKDGTIEYYDDGVIHRLNGPAVINPDGKKEYWFEGVRHRLDGPAVEYSDRQVEYWICGEMYTEQEFNKCINDLSEQTGGDFLEKGLSLQQVTELLIKKCPF